MHPLTLALARRTASGWSCWWLRRSWIMPATPVQWACFLRLRSCTGTGILETMMLLRTLTSSCTASTSFPAPLVAIQCVIAFLCRPTWFRLSQIVQIVSQCFMTRNSHRFTTFSLLHRSRLSYKEHNTCISSQQFKTFYKAYGIISHSPTDAYCLIFILCCALPPRPDCFPRASHLGAVPRSCGG